MDSAGAGQCRGKGRSGVGARAGAVQGQGQGRDKGRSGVGARAGQGQGHWQDRAGAGVGQGQGSGATFMKVLQKYLDKSIKIKFN